MTILLRPTSILLLGLAHVLPVVHASAQRHRVLRGERRDKQSRAIKKEATPKKPPAAPIPLPARKAGDPAKERPSKDPGGASKRQYQYSDYNYFVEACQEELVADVINGGIIQHSQYVDFIFGFCDSSEQRGPECNKDIESKGFDGLSNDMKLMYIKAFCPEDVDGQVSCLHGINDRGKEYQFAEDVSYLCRDLETLMIKNEFLEESGKATTANGSSTTTPQVSATLDDDPDAEYQGPQSGPPPGYSQVGAFQDDFSLPGQPQATPGPTPISTPKPTTPRPTPSPTNKRGKPKPNNPGQDQMQPPPWDSENQAPGNTGLLQEDTYTERGTGEPFPTPTLRPTYPRPDLVVLDAHGNPIVASENKTKNDEEGLSGGSKAAIVLIVLLGIVIAFTSMLLAQKRRRLRDARNPNISRNFFFMKMGRVKPMDSRTVAAEDTATYDKTYIEEEDEEEQGEEEEEQNESLGSNGEIEFNGPLFDSWPNVTSHRPTSQDDLLQMPFNNLRAHTDTTVNESTIFSSSKFDTNDEVVVDASEMEDRTDTEDEPSTFTSSLLSSFFSRAKWRGAHDDDVPSTHNAIDEIQRAIDNAQWQEVYYLASKMAAEGNIDSNENLQSALIRSHKGKSGQTATRDKLKPEDAARAAQLDVSMAAGDWITLAARAAVFAALESANNPVPASITVVNKENVDDCLAKAKAALEEAEKEQARRRALQREAASENAQEKVVYVDADEPVSERDFDYPKEDYSDFTRSSEYDDSCSASDRNSHKSLSTQASQMRPVACPQACKPQSQSTMVEEVNSDSSDDEEDSDDCDSVPTPSHLPGPPSIAMSNQSTIPTQPSEAPSVPFSNIEETYRGPFRRDFANGISYPLEQEEETELPPQNRF